jgi:hypothetical protein
MQDAQARNKDPYGSSSSDSASGRFDACVFPPLAFPPEDGNRAADEMRRYGNDSYEAVTARREAAIVLDSPELLMMHAAGRNDVCCSLAFSSRALLLCFFGGWDGGGDGMGLGLMSVEHHGDETVFYQADVWVCRA